MAGISGVDLTSPSHATICRQLINRFCVCTCTTSGIVTGPRGWRMVMLDNGQGRITE